MKPAWPVVTTSDRDVILFLSNEASFTVADMFT